MKMIQNENKCAKLSDKEKIFVCSLHSRNGIKTLAHSEIESRELVDLLLWDVRGTLIVWRDTICKTFSSVEAISRSHNKTQFHDATNHALCRLSP